MKQWLFLNILIYASPILCHINREQKIKEFLDLKKLGQEQYQDIVINGEIVSKGVRETQSRLDAIIQHVVTKYDSNREITILDIGASQGYFSFEIARLFPQSTCVMIEGNYDPQWRIADQLEDLCHLNDSLDNIIYLKKKITVEELQRLGQCEHFDIVLGFNVIHHFGDQWKEVTDAILALGDNVIIETPPGNDSIARSNSRIAHIESYIKNKGGQLIAQTPRHTANVLAPMYWIEQSKTTINLPYWTQNPRHGMYKITSTYTKKTMLNRSTNKKSQWVKGINLTTFYALHGVYPTREHITSQIASIFPQAKGDFTLWNIIIQGNNLKLIDQDDNRWKIDDTKGMVLLYELLSTMPASSIQPLLDYYTKIQAIKM